MAPSDDKKPKPSYQELIARVHALEELLSTSEQAFLKEAQNLEESKNEAEKITRELAAKVGELEHMNRFAVGRELKMIELKKQMNALCEKYGEQTPYKDSPAKDKKQDTTNISDKPPRDF